MPRPTRSTCIPPPRQLRGSDPAVRPKIEYMNHQAAFPHDGALFPGAEAGGAARWRGLGRWKGGSFITQQRYASWMPPKHFHFHPTMNRASGDRHLTS